MNLHLRPSLQPLAQWTRLSLVALAITLCIVLPFALWGDTLDNAATAWLEGQRHMVLFAILGIALLIADVVLPIPGSVVGMALCWGLGPVWGGLSMAIGLSLAFLVGYTLGRLVPEERLRQWVGPTIWDRVARRARHQAIWWIVAARPLPLLSEMSALLAGVWRVPAFEAISLATLSSCAVAALYASSAWFGLQEPGAGITLLTFMALPSATWLLHRVLVQHLGRSATLPSRRTGGTS